jgi:FMN reductase
MSVLLIAGSPSERSRSAVLLDAVQQRLQLQGAQVDRVQIRDLSPQALLLANVAHPSIAQAIAQVARATAVVVATPIYKAAYSGVLKLFLDLLPQTAFKGKTVLPVATGGSPHHMLALDYALRPVLQSLSAEHILPGVFAIDAQVVLLPQEGQQIDVELARRLEGVVDLLPFTGKRKPSLQPQYAPVQFADVRCSV